MTTFRRVLIANRGEIAVRVIRALRDLGLQSVAIYSDADEESAHRDLADFAVRLPGRASIDTYLNIPLVIDAAKRSGAEAIHPGFGFLSERADFARAIDQAGLTFIGPSAESMELMGNKVTARNCMKDSGVPVVPGTENPLQNVAELKAWAKEHGLPLILKAAAGGGGRGMRICREESQLEESFQSCQREALSYFGDDQVFCERYIDQPRHIEFQILFDHHGNGVHLFERDCSIQRRHQKLIEEAPSLYLNSEQRAKLGEIAIRAGAAVNYRGVGTVEFICESPDKAYFMEMNTRIQVEHPVTEMITGLDLIVQQIKVARGEKLAFSQSDCKIAGHSIECRINAENPVKNFLPEPGLIERLQLPAGPGVRIDTHIYQGYRIPPDYDSMIAKFISWGADRDEAIRRMMRALSEFRIHGVPTTSSFHELVLGHENFQSGDFSTAFIEQNADTIQESLQTVQADSVSWAQFIAACSVHGEHEGYESWSSEQRKNWESQARSELQQ